MNEEKGLVEAIASIVPKLTPVGTSVMLMTVQEATKFFPNHDQARLVAIFRDLRVPLIHDKGRISFNLYTLEKVLSYLTRVGGSGIALSGSIHRNSIKYTKTGGKFNIPDRVTDKDVKKMNSSIVEAERMATGKSSASLRTSYIATLREIEKRGKAVTPK